MSIKMLTFVDDLGRFPRIWGCGNYQAIILTINTHMTFADISAKVFSNLFTSCRQRL